MDLFFALGPIIVLILLMTVRGGLASHVALPLVALLMLAIKATWFGNTPALLQATVLQGMLKALTPITIVWGAIILFRTMEDSGAMDRIRQWLDGLTANPVGQLMVVGWAFVFLIEGASGFGTPAALAAPLLVGMGFPPLRAALLCLVMDTVPVTFGAVGTPIWFGLADVAATAGPGSEDAWLQAVSWQSGAINAAVALVVPPAALLLVLPAAVVRRNLGFVLLSVLVTVVPYVAVSAVSYEFPTLVGGLVGLLGSAVLARSGVGLDRRDDRAPTRDPAAKPDVARRAPGLVRALFPLWGTVLVLVVTRISQLGLKNLLTATEPAVTWSLGELGHLRVAASLRLEWLEILGQPGVNESYALLYVPALIPFVLVAGLTALLFRVPWTRWRATLTASGRQIVRPVIALLGALVLVQLLMLEESAAGGRIPAATDITGQAAAMLLGGAWQYAAVWLGVLGSFFSGSATISNLTFGAVQARIATEAGLPVAGVLALQTTGAALGNMVCIHNIVAVCSILGLRRAEGAILMRAAPLLLLGAAVATVVGALIIALG